MSRWYKQQCDIFERPWANDAKAVAIYVYLHCHAYVNGKKWHGQIIRRGSCPTSRAAIMEATGLTEQEVKSRLRKLLAYNEIIVKSSNHGNIITICDYDSSTDAEDMFEFETSSQDTTQKPAKTPPSNRPIYNNRQKNIDNNIISPYSPYNLERENKSLGLEIKTSYNKVFEGKLPPLCRLTLPTCRMVEECVRRFGRQSVDMVFEQVLNEPFSLGQNNTGFIASFQYIFTPKRFQEYLERWQLAKSKKTTARQQPQQKPVVVEASAEEASVKESPQEYEKRVRQDAADGKQYAIRIVKIWEEEQRQKNSVG